MGPVDEERDELVRTLAFVLDCMRERARSPRDEALEIARTVRAMDRDARAFGAISDDELARRIARALASRDNRGHRLPCPEPTREVTRLAAEAIVRELRA